MPICAHISFLIQYETQSLCVSAKQNRGSSQKGSKHSCRHSITCFVVTVEDLPAVSLTSFSKSIFLSFSLPLISLSPLVVGIRWQRWFLPLRVCHCVNGPLHINWKWKGASAKKKKKTLRGGQGCYRRKGEERLVYEIDKKEIKWEKGEERRREALRETLIVSN